MRKIKKIHGTAILQGNVIDSLEENSAENTASQRAINEAFETHNEVVKLATFNTSSYVEKAIENLNNFKLLLWQCCYKGQEYRVLGSIIGTAEQLQSCNNNGLTWQTTFVGDPTNFMCELYYKSDTEIYGRATGQYCMGVLYGIRK